MTRARPHLSAFLSVVIFLTTSAPLSTQASVWDDRASALRATAGKPTSPSVVLIQDIHQNVEAQQAISRMIQEQLRSGVRLVAVEGAAGLLDTSSFQRFNDFSAVQSAADFLIEQSVIAGSVHAALVSPEKATFTGVDDMARHAANAEAYRRAQVETPSVKILLADQKTKLTAKKAAVFNPALQVFDTQVAAYRDGQIDFRAYVESIAGHTSSLPASVKDFLEAARLEAGLDFTLIENARQALLANPSDPAALKNLEPYLRYRALAEKMNAEKLIEVMSGLERGAYQKLCRNEAERRLVAESRLVFLKTKLSDFSLTRQEWVEYKASGSGMSEFENFYRLAEERDTAMAEGLVAAMQTQWQRKAVLVVGGFHAQEIERILAEHKITVRRLTPKITSLPSQNPSSSLRIFVQTKTPLEKLFSGETLFLAPGVWTRPQRFLTAVVTAMRSLWLRVGSIPQARFQALVNELSGREFERAAAIIKKGEVDLFVAGKQIARILTKDGDLTGLQLADLGPDKVDRWAAVRELWPTLKLIWGQSKVREFLNHKQHLKGGWEIIGRRTSGAIALQRVMQVTAGTTALAAFVSGEPLAFVVVPVSVVTVAVMGHLFHNQLFPEAQLSMQEDPRDLVANVLQALRKLMSGNPEMIEEFFADHPDEANTLRRLVEHVADSEDALQTMVEIANNEYFGKFVAAINAAHKYIGFPLKYRQRMLERSGGPTYPGYSHDLLNTLEQTKSFGLAVRYLIHYFTDESKVGPEEAKKAHQAFMNLKLSQSRRVLKDLGIDPRPEIEHIHTLILYELSLYQKQHTPNPDGVVPRRTRVLANARLRNPKVLDPDTTELKDMPCPICGHKHSSGDPILGKVIVNDMLMSLVQCPNDKMKWLTPRPSGDDLHALYGEEYFDPVAITDQIGIRAFSEEENIRRRQIGELQMMEWKRFAGIDNPGRLVEVGPGSGHLLETAIGKGWDAVGVDISPHVVERLAKEKNLPVTLDTLETYAASPLVEPNQADVVAVYDLIEHVDDLDAFMKAVRHLLKPDGHMVIRTPNHIGRKPRLHLIDHVVHFDFETLKAFLNKHGFEITDAKPSGIFAGSKGQTLENMTVFARPKRGVIVPPSERPVALGVQNLDGANPFVPLPAHVTVLHVGETASPSEEWVIKEYGQVVQAIQNTDANALNDIVVAIEPGYAARGTLMNWLKNLRLPNHVRVAVVDAESRDYDSLLEDALEQYGAAQLQAVEALLLGTRPADLQTVSHELVLNASEALLEKWKKMIVGLSVIKHEEIEQTLKAKGYADRST